MSRRICRASAGLVLLLSIPACGGGPVGPADLDTRNESCGWCRMGVSDRRFAAQVVAPSEEPKFFDDLGCLESYLAGKKLPKGAALYVADHRTREWVPAAGAVTTRVAGLSTPMGSHLVAHADAASRDADPDARGGTVAELPLLSGDAGRPGAARVSEARR